MHPHGRLAKAVINGGWDSASLGVLRIFVLSGARLRELERSVAADVPAIHCETRTYVRLAAALRLEARRIALVPNGLKFTAILLPIDSPAVGIRPAGEKLRRWRP